MEIKINVAKEKPAVTGEILDIIRELRQKDVLIDAVLGTRDRMNFLRGKPVFSRRGWKVVDRITELETGALAEKAERLRDLVKDSDLIGLIGDKEEGEDVMVVNMHMARELYRMYQVVMTVMPCMHVGNDFSKADQDSAILSHRLYFDFGQFLV